MRWYHLSGIIGLVTLALIITSTDITGHVVSQSCCFPPDCEHLCDAATPHVEEPTSPPTVLSALLLLTAMLIYVVLNRRSGTFHHDK
jgi:hypothetical protein